MPATRGGLRQGAGRNPLDDSQKAMGYKIYLSQHAYREVNNYGLGKSFSEKAKDLLLAEIKRRKNKKINTVKFVDLFAGLGGIRLGFEQAFLEAGLKTECVLTSEIKPYAVQALQTNFEHNKLVGDITKISNESIPDFDFLLAGFPCQAFSSAGKGHGFLDTRGTLFFEVARILEAKKPYGFILENVDGLVTHDKADKSAKIGRTLETILSTLENLGYYVSWEILDSKDFGLAQSRKRVYIVGMLDSKISLNNFKFKKAVFKDIMQKGLPVINTEFVKHLFAQYKAEDLYGKSIKDKRGGGNNIHSWNIGIKGLVTDEQKLLLEKLLKERRKKQWASEIGIDWMDGMPLTAKQISTFFTCENLKKILDDLVKKGYLVFEHPKKLVKIDVGDGKYKKERQPDINKPKGYNIVSGKLSFEFSKILDPNNIAPTLVAMDVSTIGVVDGIGLRRLTLREGLRLFGYPEDYSLDFLNNNKKNIELGFDLLGNTVSVPIVKEVASRLVSNYSSKIKMKASYNLASLF